MAQGGGGGGEGGDGCRGFLKATKVGGPSPGTSPMEINVAVPAICKASIAHCLTSKALFTLRIKKQADNWRGHKMWVTKQSLDQSV